MNELIEKLIRQNFTAKTIKLRCEKQGWNPTNEEIETIRSKVQLELKAEKEMRKKKEDKADIVLLFSEQESYFEFAKRVGVNLDYQNTTELITAIQKTTAEIFLRQSLCFLRALELQSEGFAIDTTIFIRGYDIALKGVCLAWGIQNLIDVNAAFQCLESKGYLKSNHALSEIREIHEN